MDSHPTWQPWDAATPAETTAQDAPAAEEGLLLEFPLQARHHQIISTFMAEQQQHSLREDRPL